MSVRLVIKRDTANNWATNNPVLLSGEFGLDTTNNIVKIGNGTSAWSDLQCCNYDYLLTASKNYTNQVIEELVGTSPDELDTIYELAKAIESHEELYNALNDAISAKASKEELNKVVSSVTDVNTYVVEVNNAQDLLAGRISSLEDVIDSGKLESKAENIFFDNTDTSILGANVQDALVELTSEATHTKAGLLSAEDKKRIDNYADVQVIDIILYASNWTGLEAPYSQIVAVDGISTYNNCSVEMPTTATADELYAMTGANVSYDESIGFTFTVDEKPTIDILIQLCVGTSMNITEVPKYIGESPVLGVKGDNEVDYRNGYVNLTPTEIGALEVDGDSKNNIISFMSNDKAEPTSWSKVETLTSKEKHSSILSKISTMFKNVRYLYKMLGTTDISAIGDGTATGAISAINNNLEHQFTTRTLLGRGTTFNFDSTGYKFIEVVANIGGYYYSKIFLQQELIYASPNIIVNIRYDVNNYFSGYYNINSYHFSGINPTEQAGQIYIVDDIAVYGIK